MVNYDLMKNICSDEYNHHELRKYLLSMDQAVLG